MQCKADPRYSPVQGETLGAVNADGTSYSTKSAALAQCAIDLSELSGAVYGIDLTARRPLSVRELAAAFLDNGYGLARTGIDYMAALANAYGETHRAVNRTLKRALDPNGILAPGKSGIHP